MTADGELLRLVEQSVWANRQWVEFVYAQPDSDVRPRELLAHIMFGERVWFERVDDVPNTRTTTFPVLSKVDLLRGFSENVETYRRLIGGHLDKVIHFRRLSGVESDAKVIDVIHHVITHGYHHRGQLAAHYARAGVKYPLTDHIDWLIQTQR